MAAIHLLPTNATPLEIAFSETVDVYDRIDAAGLAGMRSFKYADTPAAFMPFLVYEYGLGPISAYHATYADLLAEGVAWQRVRGTPDALDQSLGWIGYDATALIDSYPARRWWTRYQIAMGELPPDGEEDPILYDAEYLAGLSDPARSIFFRGFHGYDVRALEWGDLAWGDAIWGDDSGVRMPNGETLWSHGRAYDLTVALTVDQKAALSLTYTDGDPVAWDALPWDAPGRSWTEVTDAAALHAWLIGRMNAYVGFYDADFAPIGYRRAIHVKDVTDALPAVPGTSYAEVLCRTDFGEGFGSVAAYCRVLFHARPTDLTKPGRLWLAPGEIETDPAYDPDDTQSDFVALPIVFGRTIREEVTITVEV